MSENEQTPPSGHVSVTFPNEFPSDSLLHLIGGLRGTQTLSKGEVLQHVGICMGCAGVLLDGAAPVSAHAAAEAPANPCPAPAACTKAELADAMEQCTASQSGDAAAAFPTWLIPILLDVVRRYFGI